MSYRDTLYRWYESLSLPMARSPRCRPLRTDIPTADDYEPFRLDGSFQRSTEYSSRSVSTPPRRDRPECLTRDQSLDPDWKCSLSRIEFYPFGPQFFDEFRGSYGIAGNVGKCKFSRIEPYILRMGRTGLSRLQNGLHVSNPIPECYAVDEPNHWTEEPKEEIHMLFRIHLVAPLFILLHPLASHDGSSS